MPMASAHRTSLPWEFHLGANFRARHFGQIVMAIPKLTLE